MKIVRLKAENVKRLQAVEITPEGSLVVLGGKNGQGKSSVIDALMMALGGKRAQTERPVREGATHAEIEIELDEDIVIKKTIERDGREKLELRDKQGGKYPGGAQGMLDSLINKVMIDPRQFAHLEGKKRLEILKELVGLDFAEYDRKAARIYEERTNYNRAAKDLEGQLAALTFVDGVPDEPVSVAELTQRYTDAQKGITAFQSLKQKLVHIHTEQDKKQEEIEELRKKLARAEAGLEQLRNEALSLQTQIDSTALPDVQFLKQQLEKSEELNQAIRDNKAYVKKTADLKALKEASQECTRQLAAIEETKLVQLKEAKFPIEGLGFGDNDVTYQGLPFSEICASRRVVIGAAMGFALNPTLKELFVADGPYVDAETLAELGELAAARDGRVWFEQGGFGEEVTVIIEDGLAKIPERKAA